MSDIQHSPVPPRTRPRQVKLVSVMLAVLGALGLVVSVALIALLGEEAGRGSDVPAWSYALLIAQLVISAVQIVTGILIWRGVAWARTAAAAICGLNVLGGVINILTGAALQSILGIVINIALIRLLFHDDVNDWLR
ncbi:hypothetical protein [Catenuloplanes indicus]|uniref:Uncharacterized membrane protein (DUF2068 family) n=1 Tax=Catenuloplanes indicus TaxID=137267 RepID=A0AAE4B0V2_9ACTN|nr:hypothetical protein [Catenuloplanes indicus]MDQ0369932.1 uncharacterized membrane protein (DUF2068 family) [Catenuloplanes indicus]